MKFGEHAASMQVETVPTGSLSLDLALGAGGIPKGRIIEVYGPESGGKTKEIKWVIEADYSERALYFDHIDFLTMLKELEFKLYPL